MRARVALVGLLLMADFLGAVGGAEDQGESTDYLGRAVKTAFRSEPALPAGAGPAPGVAAAPSTIGGAGTAPGASVASAGGGAGGAAGPTTLAQIARSLGLSETALRSMDWAKRLFGDKPDSTGPPSGAPVPATSQAFLDEIARGEVPPGDFDPQLAALVREAMAADTAGETAALIAGGDMAMGAAGGLGLAGAGLTLAGQLSGNKDVSRSGQAATGVGAAGSAIGSTVGGAAAPLALPALGYTGMNIADQVETDARIRRDVANAKNVLGAKVPSAVSRLGKTLNDLSTLDPASATTEQLLAAQQSLQAARQEFNAVDHAFKGALTIAGKPVDTGLSLDMVKPQLDALNESQLRIQDLLEQRGIQSGQIPGYRSPQDWLSFVDEPLYQQYTTGTPGFDPSTNMEMEPGDLQNPAIAAALKGMQPGQTEQGLRQLIARGLPARVPRPVPESLVGPAFGGGEDFAPVVSAMDAP